MKHIAIGCIALAAALTAGCTVKETRVVQSSAPPAVVYQQPAPTVVYQPPATTVVYQQPTVLSAPPTITYSVSSQKQYNQAAMLASDWCRARRGAGARIVDTKAGSRGLATFACVTA
jgi:hypothetical protein